jgi:hypothetical protein
MPVKHQGYLLPHCQPESRQYRRYLRQQQVGTFAGVLQYTSQLTLHDRSTKEGTE